MTRKQTVKKVVDAALDQVGYRSRAQQVNQYGAQLGTDGHPWSGAFLETVMRGQDQRGLPNLNHTTAALAEFMRTGRNFRVPRVGDIVFLAYSTSGPFSQQNIGLVTDASLWREFGRVTAVIGQTNTGDPKGVQEVDGVYERTVYAVDVLTFVRPKYAAPKPRKGTGSDLTVTVAQVQPNSRHPSKRIAAMQHALFETVGARGMKRGEIDSATRAAIGAYQRKIGYGAPTGVLDKVTLDRLSSDTDNRYFRLPPNEIDEI